MQDKSYDDAASNSSSYIMVVLAGGCTAGIVCGSGAAQCTWGSTLGLDSHARSQLQCVTALCRILGLFGAHWGSSRYSHLPHAAVDNSPSHNMKHMHWEQHLVLITTSVSTE